MLTEPAPKVVHELTVNTFSNATSPASSWNLQDVVFELRHVGKLNTRVLYFFMIGQRIIAVHGIRNKGQAIARHDRAVALDRMRDWLTRQQP